jgi:hypothetical protein
LEAAPFASCGRASADAELGAAAIVDPEAALVDSPGLALNAGRSADLAVELDVATTTSVAPVSLAVIGGAGDDLRGWWSRRRAVACAEGEVSTAATVDPEAAIVDAPGIAADAGRAADLADELDIAAVTDGAPVSFAIVGGAVDSLLPWPEASALGEFGTASSINPEAAVVDAPGVAANAGRTADLADELGVARPTNGTPVSFAVVGGAGDSLLSVAGLRVCGCRYSEGDDDNGEGDQEKHPCACHLASFEMKIVARIRPDGRQLIVCEMRIFGLDVACREDLSLMKHENGHPHCRDGRWMLEFLSG